MNINDLLYSIGKIDGYISFIQKYLNLINVELKNNEKGDITNIIESFTLEGDKKVFIQNTIVIFRLILNEMKRCFNKFSIEFDQKNLVEAYLTKSKDLGIREETHQIFKYRKELNICNNIDLKFNEINLLHENLFNNLVDIKANNLLLKIED